MQIMKEICWESKIYLKYSTAFARSTALLSYSLTFAENLIF